MSPFEYDRHDDPLDDLPAPECDELPQGKLEDYLREHEQAIYQEASADEQLTRDALIRAIELEILSRPLAASGLSDHILRLFNVEYLPLGKQPDGRRIRDLFSEASHRTAQQQVNSPIADIAWAAAQFLHWRNEALGKYCYNTNCPTFPTVLRTERPRRGRPRLYCSEKCRVSGVKRHQRNAKDPFRVERLRDLSTPRFVRGGYAGKARHGVNRKKLKTRDFDHPDWTPRHEAILRERGVPQADEIARRRQLEEADAIAGIAESLTLEQAMARLRRRQRSRTYFAHRNWGKDHRARKRKELQKAEKLLGISLRDVLFEELKDGRAFSDEEVAAFEELLGASLDSLVTGDDEDGE